MKNNLEMLALLGKGANLVEKKDTFRYTLSKGTLLCKLFYFKGNETGFGASAMKLICMPSVVDSISVKR